MDSDTSVEMLPAGGETPGTGGVRAEGLGGESGLFGCADILCVIGKALEVRLVVAGVLLATETFGSVGLLPLTDREPAICANWTFKQMASMLLDPETSGNGIIDRYSCCKTNLVPYLVQSLSPTWRFNTSG
jgi:hypothetical protein